MAKIENIQSGSGYARAKIIGWTLDNVYTLVDPVFADEQAKRQGLNTEWWRKKAGTILWPSGQEPGKIWILLTRYDINHINLNALHTLKIRFDADTLTFNNLVFSAPLRNIMGLGYTGGEKCIYLAELSDLRHLMRNKWFSNPVNVHYNVPAPDTGTVGDYHQDSMNGGSAWTWQGVLDNLWTLMTPPSELGSSPQLGWSPHGVPQNLRFVGVSGWEAYNEVLKRLGVDFVLWPDGTTRLVRRGETDTSLVAALAQWNIAENRFDDEEPLEIIRGKIPRQVVVYFPKIWEHYGAEFTTEWRSGYQTSLMQAYSVTIDCPDAIEDYTQANSKAVLWDDMSALTNIGGTVTNSAGLAVRAQERADDYYRMVYTGGNRMLLTFNRWIFDTGLFNGSQVSAVAWYDHGQGARMQIFNSAAEYIMDCENGCMVNTNEYQISENWRSHDFARHSFANYPHLIQLGENVSVTPTAAGVYDGYLNYVDPDGVGGPSVERLHQIWIFDPNS